MSHLQTLLVALSLALAAAAAALPGETPSSAGAPAPPPPGAETTPAPPAPGISMPATCDYSYCDGTSSWCFYWAGVTSYDISRGPVPGEIRVPLGLCAPPHPAPPTAPAPDPAHTRPAA